MATPSRKAPPDAGRPQAACCDHDHGPGPHDHRHGHDHSPAPAPVPAPASALVSARGLAFARGGRTILTGVDVDVCANEIVTLIGPNGAGKTTLVRLLLGLDAPDSGTIQRRDGLVVGYVPQKFAADPALPMTVARFLALGLSATAAEIAAALEEVGAARVGGQQLTSLSGGEVQRVLLARALLRRPHLLVLDEPVKGVDFIGEAELYRLIADLRAKRGFGVLLVSHDLHVVMAASDRVLCLNRHICCSGVPRAVAKHPEYARLFGRELAAAYAVYEHHHDHAHAIDGSPVPGGNEEPMKQAAGDEAP